MTEMTIPVTGFLRLTQIIGNARTSPPTLGVFPISRTAWLDGVRDGRYLQPVKLSERTVAWRAEDIRALVEDPTPRPDRWVRASEAA